MDQKRKNLAQGALVKAVSTDNEFAFIATKKVMDRDNELILPMSLDLTNFRKNAIMDAGHSAAYDPTNLLSVVAKVNQIEQNETEIPAIGEWFMESELARTIRKAYEGGFLNAFSITFLGQKWRRPTEEEVKEFGEDLEYTLEKGELLTISPVIVPSNREALYARGFGFLDSVLGKTPDDAIEQLLKRVEILEEKLKINEQEKLDQTEAKLIALDTDLTESIKIIRKLTGK